MCFLTTVEKHVSMEVRFFCFEGIQQSLHSRPYKSKLINYLFKLSQKKLEISMNKESRNFQKALSLTILRNPRSFEKNF